MQDLTDFGLHYVTAVKHVSGVSDSNRDYMAAKKDWGHALDEKDLGAD